MDLEKAGVTVSLVLIAIDMIKTYGYDKRDKEQTKKEVAALQEQTAKHYKECETRHEDSSALSVQVKNVSVSLEKVEETQQWMGDGIVKIAAKMNVDLPQRP